MSDDPSRVPAFDDHYTDEQRDAVCSAWNDRGIRPASRVASLAFAGELTRPDGSKVPPFGARNGQPIPEGTVRSLARYARKRRRGELTSGLAQMPPRDAVESLRVRLVSVADHELARIERKQAKSGEPLDAEHFRQVTRAVLELSRLPGPTDPRPASPGTRDVEGRRGPETRGGLAGALMQDHRGGAPAERQDPEPEPAPAPVLEPEDDSGPAVAGPEDPGAFVAGAIARMSG